jgi:hypothetical protein
MKHGRKINCEIENLRTLLTQTISNVYIAILGLFAAVSKLGLTQRVSQYYTRLHDERSRTQGAGAASS